MPPRLPSKALPAASEYSQEPPAEDDPARQTD